MKILKLSLKEIKKKKLFSLLMFLVCVIAMQTILSAVTNAASTTYQKKVFENSMGVNTENVLHLHYQYNEESQEFAETLKQYIDYIENIPGVEAVGQFDMMGMYFSELETMEEYQEVNKKFVQGTKYEPYPAITQLLSVDEELLPFVKGNITEYDETQSGFLPLYVSERFESTLPVGTVLTDGYTGDNFEIVGYISKDTAWVDENDLIRFPFVSLDGWFIAPFSEKSKSDIMTQLSMLHNTYVMLSDNADVSYIKDQIAEYPLQHGFAATSSLLSEEYETYRLETESFTNRQIVLAIFISIMVCSSIVAAFTTNALLKKNQYGVLIANGFTLTDISMGIATEIFIIIFSSGLLSWVIKWIEFESGKDLFKDVLLTAHIYYALPLCIVIVLVLTVVAAALPAVTVFRYQPCELIGGIKMATIELKNIKKDYRNDTIVTHALSGVDLKIDAGEFVAIMGTSGSGKTTLLNIIGCMDIPTSGTYCFENMQLNNATEKQLSSIRGKKISFIFQHFALIDDYTVFENVEIPLIKQSLSKSERKKKVLSALELVGISDLEKKKPTQISGGQKQRVAIARAIVCGADTILADEPTGALDSTTGKEIMRLFSELNAMGKTIILITHDGNVAAYANRLIAIEDGRIVKDEILK